MLFEIYTCSLLYTADSDTIVSVTHTGKLIFRKTCLLGKIFDIGDYTQKRFCNIAVLLVVV